MGIALKINWLVWKAYCSVEIEIWFEKKNNERVLHFQFATPVSR